MGTASLPWVDNGAEFEVSDLPANGKHELLSIDGRNGKALAIQGEATIVWFQRIVIAARDFAEEKGPEFALRAWNSTLKGNGWDMENLTNWKVEEFQDRIDALFDENVLAPLGVTSKEEAVAELKAREKDINKRFTDLSATLQEYIWLKTVAEIYWTLKRSGCKAITPPGGGKEVPFDWSKEAREDMREAIGEYATQDDLGILRKARTRDSARAILFDKHMLDEPSEEAMRGKSTGLSEPSKSTDADSMPSSESPTGTAQPQETTTR